MINIWIGVDNSGNLRSIKAEGHSMSALKGSNIVCAAVTSQLRSVVRVMESADGCQSSISAEHDGQLALEIMSCNDNRWLAGVTDVLLAGLIEIERDFPDECKIELIKMN